GPPDIAWRRMNNVSQLAGRPAAERRRASAAGSRFVGCIAPQPLQALRAEAVGAACDGDAKDLDFGGARVAVCASGDLDAHAVGGERREVHRALDQIVAADRRQSDPGGAVPTL